MDVVHLNQKQLAARWHLSAATLERWRSEGLGPKFLKLCGRVIYRQVDIVTDRLNGATDDRRNEATGEWLKRGLGRAKDQAFLGAFASAAYSGEGDR